MPAASPRKPHATFLTVMTISDIKTTVFKTTKFPTSKHIVFQIPGQPAIDSLLHVTWNNTNLHREPPRKVPVVCRGMLLNPLRPPRASPSAKHNQLTIKVTPPLLSKMPSTSIQRISQLLLPSSPKVRENKNLFTLFFRGMDVIPLVYIPENLCDFFVPRGVIESKNRFMCGILPIEVARKCELTQWTMGAGLSGRRQRA